MRVAPAITLTDKQRLELQGYARGRSIAQRLVERAKIILLAGEGKENLKIAEQLAISRHTVARWRARFIEQGITGIAKDAPRAVGEAHERDPLEHPQYGSGGRCQ